MTQSLKISFLIACFLFAISANSQHRFIANKNQWPEQVNFACDVPGGKLYLEKTGLTFSLYDTETVNQVFAAHKGHDKAITTPKTLDCFAYQIRFMDIKGSSSQGEKKTKGIYNYFIGKDKEKWASGARAYEAVRYPELYSSIDLRVYSNGNLKYDFIVKPGGQVNDIQLAYEGIKPKINSNGELVLKTSVGSITEKKPFAYQYIDGEMQKVVCSYSLKNGILQYKVGAYNKNEPLIIDPELIFSTYSGSTSDNFGYTATYDDEGHLYSGSTAFGTGYPVTLGAFQTTWAGGSGAGLPGTDIALTKFNLDGTGLIYSTYLGGSEDELPHSLITDDEGNLYVFGTTGSDDFPITEDAFQQGFLGGTSLPLTGIGVTFTNGCDMIVARLSSEGDQLVGSTYVGGSENDGTNTSTNLKYNYADEVRGEIELDSNGNVLVGSCTFSDDFPVTGGAFQEDYAGGQEAVIFRFDPTMSELLHSSYFGSAGDDAFYSINFFEDGTIMAGGGSSSNDLPTTAGVVQENFGGGQADGMIVNFTTDFSNTNQMSYYGSDAYDQVYFIERDIEGNPHIYGQTEASGSQFIINADYGTSNSGMLLANFNPTLESVIWSTVFGTGNNVPNLSPTAFSVDICNRIYLSGWGGTVNSQGSTSGLDVTDDALQSTTDGSDFYFMVLEGDASDITFGSFYGGSTSAEHVDGGTSRFDRAGKIYQAVCAGCGSNDDFPIFPADAHSPTNNSNNCNLGVAKIDFDLPLVIADFESEEVCLPLPTTFNNTSEITSETSASYQWFFGDGGESSDENPAYEYSEPGTYEVTLIVSDPEACNLADTVTIDVEVFPPFFLEVPSSVVECFEDSLTIIAETAGTANFFQWSTDPEFNNIILEGPTDSSYVYTDGQLTTIYLLASNGSCEATQEILLAPMPVAELSIPDTTLCNMPEVEISVEITNGYEIVDIIWVPQDLIIEGQGTPTATLSIGPPTNFAAVATTEFGCEVGPKVTLANYSIALEASPDTLTCENTPIDIEANSFGTAESFIWSSDPGFTDILNPGGDSLITVNPSSVTYYYVLAENNECALIDSVAVSQLVAGTSITSDQYICAGDTATIVVSNDFPGNDLTHEWEPKELILSGQGTDIIQAIVTEPTTFSVTSSTSQGCVVENSSTVFVSELGNLDINATANPQNINPGTSSELQVIPAIDDYVYQWEPPDFLNTNFGTSPISTPPSTISYIVTITDLGDDGFCSKSDTVTIFVFESVCGEPTIFVPNAFTPNGDGENDELFVRGNNITDLKFSVFNRWGEKVFETSEQNRGWDGTYKGELANPAVFVYQLEVVCGDGQEYFAKGNVTLIR